LEVGLQGPRWLGIGLSGYWDRRNDRIFAGIGSSHEGEPEVIKSRYRGALYRFEASWLSPSAGPVRFLLRAGADARNYSADDVRVGPSIDEAYGATPDRCAVLGLPSPCVDPEQ